MSRKEDIAKRRNAIRRFARQHPNQPLQAHVLKREVHTATGMIVRENTIRTDIRAVIDADRTDQYGLRRGALIYTPEP